MAPKIKTISGKVSAARSNVWFERVVCALFGATMVTIVPPVVELLQVRFGKSELQRDMEKIEAWSDCIDKNKTDSFEAAKVICGQDPDEHERKQKK